MLSYGGQQRSRLNIRKCESEGNESSEGAPARCIVISRAARSNGTLLKIASVRPSRQMALAVDGDDDCIGRIDRRHGEYSN